MRLLCIPSPAVTGQAQEDSGTRYHGRRRGRQAVTGAALNRGEGARRGVRARVDRGARAGVADAERGAQAGAWGRMVLMRMRWWQMAQA